MQSLSYDVRSGVYLQLSEKMSAKCQYVKFRTSAHMRNVCDMLAGVAAGVCFAKNWENVCISVNV